MKTTETILDRIMVDVRRELAEAQSRRPLAELQRMISDAPAIRPLPPALQKGFGLIAEIKERSPSQGAMRRQNIDGAAAAYEQCGLVRAISVLTNATHFGMSMERLWQVKTGGTKPVLRKDFIFDDYQVYEARAVGADAILLMANLLSADELHRLYNLARALNLEALFECHDREQIEQVPPDAKIYGINSRNFATGEETYDAAKAQRQSGANRDFTTDLTRFDLARHLPPHAIKVAESGVYPETVAVIRDELGYDAVLVGTSLLTAPHGVVRELEMFA